MTVILEYRRQLLVPQLAMQAERHEPLFTSENAKNSVPLRGKIMNACLPLTYRQQNLNTKACVAGFYTIGDL